jgi:hypothetical protein
MKKLALTLLAISSIHAAEVDQFVGRDAQLEDALPIINAKANTLFEEAIATANEKEQECNEKKLYKVLRKKFRNQYTSEFSKWIVDTDEIQKITTKTSEGIYQDFSMFQSIVIGLFSKISDPAGQTMRVNGVFIGTDKFEHFLGSGFNYFKKQHLKGKTLEDAMNIGVRAETGFLGAITTGVMSYADMVANFNGMRFWNKMLAKRLDPLTGEEVTPYLSCSDGTWKKEQDIDFSIYIDHTWDEGINCSWLRTEKMVEKVQGRLENYSIKYGKEITCPMEPEKLVKDGEKYSDLPIEIINYRGHQSIKENK